MNVKKLILIIIVIVFIGCKSKNIILKQNQNSNIQVYTTKNSNRNFVEVAWQNNYNLVKHQNVPNPIDSIQKDIISQIETYLKQRKPIDITAKIPPEIKEMPYPKKIPKPTKPKDIILVRGDTESPENFRKRQKKERDRVQKKYERLIADYNKKVKIRKEKIIQQNKIYNEKVKNRNLEIERLKKIRKKDIAYLQKEYRYRRNNIINLLPIFAKKSFAKYLGNPIVIYQRYIYEQQTLLLKIKSEYSNFEKLIQLKISPKEAKNIQKNNNLAKVKVVYTLSLNKNNLSFTFNRFNIIYNNHIYLASSISNLKAYRPSKVKITINSTKTFIPDIAPQKQAIRQENYVPNKINLLPVPKVVIVSDNDLIEDLKKIKSPIIKDSKKWLFVIGIENYDYTDNISFSKRTTETFFKVIQKISGIKKNHSFKLIEEKATSGKIEAELNNMLKKVKDGDSIYFYYSGHGIPILPERTPYMLPKDKIPDYINRSPFFKLSNIYNLLSNSKASKIIVIMDSCFSGSTDGKSIIKGVAGVILPPKKVTFNHKKMLILTAGKATQFSNMYPQKGHRLFSYFVMKALLEGKRSVRDIYNEVYPHVKEISNGFGDLKRQEPTIEGNEQLSF